MPHPRAGSVCVVCFRKLDWPYESGWTLRIYHRNVQKAYRVCCRACFIKLMLELARRNLEALEGYEGIKDLDVIERLRRLLEGVGHSVVNPR